MLAQPLLRIRGLGTWFVEVPEHALGRASLLRMTSVQPNFLKIKMPE
jgi:hypothetical protein